MRKIQVKRVCKKTKARGDKMPYRRLELLFSARTDTLEINSKKKEEQKQSCSFCVGVKEVVILPLDLCDSCALEEVTEKKTM